jgi:uncharacterized protein YqeY
MPIYDAINEQLKDAMRAKDAGRLAALRGIRSAFILAMKQDGSTTLTDAACVDALKRLAKQRRESVDAYTAGGRPELAESEAAELAVIESFIPAGPSDEAVRGWVQEAIAASGATTAREVPKVMGLVMKAHKGEVDGAVVRTMAEALLQG